MGPGTHIITNIINIVEPTSYTDSIALVHDINYLIATGSHVKLKYADDLAIKKAQTDFPGLTMKIGLTLRKMLHLKESENVDNRQQMINTGRYLKNLVLTSPGYAKIRQTYNITTKDFLV